MNGDAPATSGASDPGIDDRGRMTPAELRVFTERLGLRQRDVARLLEVNERTVRSWMQGRDLIAAGIAGDIARMVAATDDFVDQVADALGEQAPGPDGCRWVTTYASDEAYLAEHPDASMPASWHRAAMGRVMHRLAGVRVRYLGDPT